MESHDIFFESQLDAWQLAKENYKALGNIKNKDFSFDGVLIRAQCNPSRITSSTAKISPTLIMERPCFLCRKNRPKEQEEIKLDLKGEEYSLLVNPFPVFPKHYTITADHKPQQIKGNFGRLLSLASILDDSVVFYNGPKCGASAPDHMHFQAGNKGILPVETGINEIKARFAGVAFESDYNKLYILNNFLRGGWIIEGNDEAFVNDAFEGIYNAMMHGETSAYEPMMNILCWFEKGFWTCMVFPRKAHRPECYNLDEPEKMLISPASVEMGGLLIAARPEDFGKLNEELVRKIYEDVSLADSEVETITNRFLQELNLLDACGEKSSISNRNLSVLTDNPTAKQSELQKKEEPKLNVGIISGREIRFILNNVYKISASDKPENYCGEYVASFDNGKIRFQDNVFEELEFIPVEETGSSFELPEVIIGIDFHWERKESQTFEGNLRIIVEDDKLTAVNRIPLESYLTSVISSEMSAKASMELLKAHAVISRSWLLSQINQKGKNHDKTCGFIENEHERIKWYDREDHQNFDVCADDHCQRYQGITKASTPQVREAIKATRGQVLFSDGEICDARFSKCCGGVLEEFQNCWEDTPKPYLKGLADKIDLDYPDLSIEENARAFILSSPEAFCNTKDKNILSQVLNNYDQETTNFYRWQVKYSASEISALVKKKSGIDFGDIVDLIPVERGVSGRLVRLRIVGTKRTMVIGKELEIRKTLSETHLYSSAFIPEKTSDGFVLYGAGWGHGVGLCQIGAAVMGEKGYKYDEILTHYYPEAEIKLLYK